MHFACIIRFDELSTFRGIVCRQMVILKSMCVRTVQIEQI